MSAVVSSAAGERRLSLWFPLALVLFEFSVYIANDMVQPAMLAVVREFHASLDWVPTSMTAFLVGGALLPWLTGPLSDRIGRRPVLLAGVAWFVLACLATYLADSIETFMLVRVLQGLGLCFINAVGYAAVQEAFNERTAIKVTALMANVALIAPLIGPLAGAALIEVAPWRLGFLFIAALAMISFVGLWRCMPETVDTRRQRPPLSRIAVDYRTVLGNLPFVIAAFAIPLLSMPLMGWIALSPVLLVENLGLTPVQYGLLQIPVFAGLILGNLLLVWLTDRWPLGRSVLVGIVPMVIGLALMVGGETWSAGQAGWLVGGMSLVSLGEGLSFAVLYRFALTASQVAKGTVSASVSMLSMIGYAAGLEGFRLVYAAAGPLGFIWLGAAYFVLYLLFAGHSVRRAMRERAQLCVVPPAGAEPAQA